MSGIHQIKAPVSPEIVDKNVWWKPSFLYKTTPTRQKYKKKINQKYS